MNMCGEDLPVVTEAVCTASNAGVVQNIHAYGALFVVLDSLREKGLQPDLVFWRDVLCGLAWIILLVGFQKLFSVVGRYQTGVQCELPQTSKHAQSIRCHLDSD